MAEYCEMQEVGRFSRLEPDPGTNKIVNQRADPPPPYGENVITTPDAGGICRAAHARNR